MGSAYNLCVRWEDGTQSWVPARELYQDHQVSVLTYIKEQGLENERGFIQWKSALKRIAKMHRLLKQAKLRSYEQARRFKNGYEIPKNYVDAMLLDKLNGNNRWYEATEKEK
jgi:hypothetical protein